MFSPVWSDIRGQRRKDHPAPYPAELARRIIRMFSFSGDTVLDPFGGTGSTAVAALAEGRNSVSVDVEPTYVDSIVARLASCEGGRSDVTVYKPAETDAVPELRIA